MNSDIKAGDTVRLKGAEDNPKLPLLTVEYVHPDKGIAKVHWQNEQGLHSEEMEMHTIQKTPSPDEKRKKDAEWSEGFRRAMQQGPKNSI